MTDAGGTVPWRELLAEATERLGAAGVVNAGAEARWLVEQASGADGGALTRVLDAPATRRGVAHFDAMLARRVQGEPLQYVLGAWGFRRLDLAVDARALIPRPETEVVVDHVLDAIDRRPALDRPARVVDLGTGSGAIALAVAFERPGVEVWAVDRSADALALARANLAGLGRAGARVQIVEGWWCDALPDELRGTVDVVVSNPPYVADDEDLPPDVEDWEPRDALRSGPTGLEDFERILAAVGAWLVPRGSLVLEVAPHRADAVGALARSGGFDEVDVYPDLSGRARVVVARRRARPT